MLRIALHCQIQNASAIHLKYKVSMRNKKGNMASEVGVTWKLLNIFRSACLYCWVLSCILYNKCSCHAVVLYFTMLSIQNCHKKQHRSFYPSVPYEGRSNMLYSWLASRLELWKQLPSVNFSFKLHPSFTHGFSLLGTVRVCTWPKDSNTLLHTCFICWDNQHTGS